MKAALAAVVATLALVAPASAAPGQLDDRFGDGGTATTDFPVVAEASIVLRQPDGKQVAIGTVGSSAFALARYDPGGTLDLSFGANGRTLTEMGRDVAVRDAALQEDGKILVTGMADGRGAAARYNPDGSLDPSFGTAGIARTGSGAPYPVAPSSAATQSHGSDVAAIATRFEAAMKPTDTRPLALAVEPGREILVAGSASLAGQGDAEFAQLAAGASPQSAPGAGGLALYPLGEGLRSKTIQAAAVQPGAATFARGTRPATAVARHNARVVLAGTVRRGGRTHVAVARYLPDGTLDPSFGAGGPVILPNASVAPPVRGLAIDSDGRIVVAGGGGGLTLVRLAPNGGRDPSFGRSGRIRPSLAGWLRPEGITAAGRELVVYGESDGHIALARYHPDGSVDRSFGRRGAVVSSIPAFDPGTARATVQPQGRMIVAGSYRGRFALAAFGADGSVDRSFGHAGRAVSPVRGAATATAPAPGEGILVAGSPTTGDDGRFVVARFDGAGVQRVVAPAKPPPAEKRHPHRGGPPHPVPAWYINASNLKELKRFAAQDVCKFARSQPRSAQRTVILDFGGARAYGNGRFGAAVNNAAFEATNQQIRAALTTAADAYAACHRRGRATITYANTNHFSLRSNASRAHQIGVHQATTVALVGGYLHHAGYSPAVHAGIAGDIEPGFWGPSQSKAMVNGAKSVRRHGYAEFGTAGGCPPYLKGQPRPGHQKCLNDWTLDDVAHVSNSGGGEPLPEIYYRGGRYRYDQAAQWARVARRWNSKHATPYSFFGATASTEFSAMAPVSSWKRLKHKTTGHVGRELVNFKQDRGKPVPAARGPDAPRG